MTEGESDPVGSKKFRSDPTEFLSDSDPDFVGIRRNMIEIRPDPTRISSGSVEFRRNPGRNPAKTLSDPTGFL